MLYLHIPFCKQACHYCNFHFSTSLRHKTPLVEAMIMELELRKDYLSNTELQSIYFGGGTPSLLSESELNQLFEAIFKYFSLKKGAEITLEANPDDLDKETIAALKKSPINRLSIGVQSFFDTDLKWMNRAHSAQEADGCIKRAQDAGFENLTIDLIYGSPTTTDAMWAENLKKATALDVPHVSSYCLTVEEKTALAHMVKTGKTIAPTDQTAMRQFLQLMDWAAQRNWHHYEISNFSKKGKEAVHNSAYWNGTPYLGIGPAAHSFDGQSRQWNIANNPLYIKAIEAGTLDFEREYLSEKDLYNEYVMTGLRLSRGVSKTELLAFGSDYWAHFLHGVQEFLDSEEVLRKENTFALSRIGKLRADGITAELFVA